MENKKIYVDGVDVGGCEYACNTAFGKNGCKYPMMKNIYCSKNPNCYFKQLARKTQECERSRKRISDLEERIINHSNEIEEYCSRLADKNKECEELLKENQQLRNSLSDSLMFKFTGQENETNRYRKALEEIKGLVKNFCKDCGDYEDCNWEKEGCYYSLIPNLKDIINEVKEK